MPTYSTVCKSCARTGQVWRRVADRDSLDPCPCGGRLERVITAPMLRAEIPSYISPASGKLITSHAERKEDLLRTGSIAWEPGIRQEIERRRQSNIAADYARMDATIDKTIGELSASGRI